MKIINNAGKIRDLRWAMSTVDMSLYDADNDGIIDNSEKFDGKTIDEVLDLACNTIDGGSASSVYMFSQIIDGGGAVPP